MAAMAAMRSTRCAPQPPRWALQAALHTDGTNNRLAALDAVIAKGAPNDAELF